MAQTPTLPSAQSVVDFLNTQKKDSSFSARSKLYKDAGLDRTLGEYVGSASQNINLLKGLQKPPATAVDTVDTMKISTPVPSVTDVTLGSRGLTGTADTLDTLKIGGTTTPKTMTATGLLANAGVPQFTPAPVTAQAPAPTSQQQSTYQGNSIVDFLKSQNMPSDFTSRTKLAAQYGIKDYAGSTQQNIELLNKVRNATPEQKNDVQVKEEVGISASDIYPDIFGANATQGEGDLVNEWLKSPEGQLFLDKQAQKGADEAATAAAAKQTLESKYRTDRTTLEQNLAEKGLAFSGIRGSQVAALATSLAASLLKEDRDTASKLLNADLDLREAIIKGVADLAKEADAGRKEAIQQLNAIGYAVINGKLVPTLASQAADRADAAAARAERSLQLSERRLANVEANAGKSGNKLTMAEAQSRNLPLTLVGQTEEDVIASLYSSTAPDWFVEKVNKEAQQTLLPDVVNKLWAKASQEYLTGVKESSNHSKAASYFKSAYGDAVDAETIQALADLVEQEINGGLSYKEAITKVIEENS